MFFVAVWGSFGDLQALDMGSKRRKMLQQIGCWFLLVA